MVVLDLSSWPDMFYRSCLVPHRTSPMKTLPTTLFEVGAINSPSPRPDKSNPRPASTWFYRSCLVPHRTSPMKTLPTTLFEVGAINSPSPTPRATQKIKNHTLRSKFELLSLSLSKFQALILVLERRFKLP
jgi:hypothetical protein